LAQITHGARKLRLGLAAVTAACAIVLGTAVPASAALRTYKISATLGCGGALLQGTTYRPHAQADGPATIKLTSHRYWRDFWELRVGLRVGGSQTTQSLEFKPTSRTTHTFRTARGSTSLPTARYATNSRVNFTPDGRCAGLPPTYSADHRL